MTNRWEPEREPTPEQLAAYLDGELAGVDRAGVQHWLATHPDAQAEVEALRQVQAQYDRVPVPEPSAAAWERTLRRIEADLSRGRSWSWAVLAGLAAAAILGVLFLRNGGTQEDNEPLPVATADDVRIISMNPNDHGAIVGVRPLLLQDLDLVTHAEIEVFGGNNDGVLRIDDWMTPMLVDPQSVGGPR
jgi:hypothetical protein